MVLMLPVMSMHKARVSWNLFMVARKSRSESAKEQGWLAGFADLLFGVANLAQETQ